MCGLAVCFIELKNYILQRTLRFRLNALCYFRSNPIEYEECRRLWDSFFCSIVRYCFLNCTTTGPSYDEVCIVALVETTSLYCCQSKFNICPPFRLFMCPCAHLRFKHYLSIFCCDHIVVLIIHDGLLKLVHRGMRLPETRTACSRTSIRLNSRA